MQVLPLHRTHPHRRFLAAALLAGGSLLALNGSLRAQTTYTFTNGGTPASTSTFQTATNWSPNGIPTSTATTTDTAIFDGTGGGTTAGTSLTLTDTVTDGGAAGSTGIILNMTSGQAGALRINDTASVRLSAVNIDAGAGALAISSVLVGGLTTTTTNTFTNNSSNTFTMSGLQAGGTGTRTLSLVGTGNFAVSGAIISNLNIVKGNSTITGTSTDTSVLTLTNTGGTATSFSGALTINTGIVSINYSAALGTTSGATTFNSGGASGNNGLLQLSNNISTAENFVIGGRNVNLPVFDNVSGNNSLTGTMTLNSGGNTYTFQSDAGTLTITGALAVGGASTATKLLAVTGAGNTQFDGVVGNGTGTLTLTKTGAGVLTLTNANNYTGATTVSGGALLVNGNNSAATGAVGVSGTGTILGGTGTVGGVVTVNSGAILQGGAGTAIGTLTLTANPVLNAGSIIGLTLDAGNAHSTLALPGTFNGFQTNQNFTLAGLQAGTYDNIITGVASGITTSGWMITNGSGFSYTFTDDGSNIDLVVTAVPEPSTWVAGLLCAGIAAVGLRRRLDRA